MIQSDLINRDALPRKYRQELHANEIVLLAYYIASVNIENAYHATVGEKTQYVPFNGICLTDTFQLGENADENALYTPALKQNSERVQAQQKAPIQVIIGNPPYSVGQKSANDNAQNQHYAKLEKRLAMTYVVGASGKSKKSLYDSYIKAFRWASDRLSKKQGGIIAFVSNASWLDGNAMDGMRKCLEQEFSEIYVFNLRGNQRTSGETSRREGGKIFGSGSRTPIAITVLIRNPAHKGKSIIHYHDIGDYLSREEKLAIVAREKSVLNPEMDWTQLYLDAHGDWLNQRNDVFSSFIPLGDKKNKDNKHTVFVPVYSLGIGTNRDVWCWNYSRNKIAKNIKYTINYYNEILNIHINKSTLDPRKISWSSNFQRDWERKIKKHYDESAIRDAVFRPFSKQKLYFSKEIDHRIGTFQLIFPTISQKNISICVSGIGVLKNFSCIVTNFLPDLELIGKSQCFPLYWYDKKTLYQPTLFDGKNTAQYTRHDGITDFILERCRTNYSPKVTKEDIFYYVYGLLHSPDYRRSFAANLKKELPRLPLVEKPADFWAFSKAGRALADLHLNYETQPPCSDVVVEGAESGQFQVKKMLFPNKADKSVIEYNPWIKLTHIPLEAYEYVVNGRSAIEWIMERYQIRTDKDSGITNDPNDWATEHGKPRYILDLLLSVITVSLETLKIIQGLPKLDFPEATQTG